MLDCSKTADGHCIFVQGKINDVVCVIMYKSPKFPAAKFLDKIRSILCKSFGQMMFLGDININLFSSDGFAVKQLYQEFGFHSLVPNNRSSTNGHTQIDCCFCNFTSQNVKSWFYESYYSYHKPMCVVWDC